MFNSNFRVLKCIKLLFSIKGIKTNYGFFALTFLLGMFIAFIIIHIILGENKIINIINKIIKIRENKEIEKDKKSNNSVKDDEKESQNLSGKSGVNVLNKNQTNENNELYLNDVRSTFKNKMKRNNKKLKSKISKIIKNINEIIYTNEELNKATITLSNEKDNNDENKYEDENKIKEKYKDLTDEEKNDLDYKFAIIIDKRTFWQYYNKIDIYKKS